MSSKKPNKHRHLPAFILLALAENSSHGGAIYTSLIEKLPNFQCDTGAIYRTLQKLEEDKAVTFSWDTTNSGPARKVYTITDIGLIQLDNWKQDIEDRITILQCFLNEYNHLKDNQ
ncbi:PadR family transcriptional regulator [Clostridium hydrogenum]|uniref:PadR family transcriptional regulator n=1 Tax=Clostridium hydrogenum TaxID=2855764 RepID=UPI001F4767B1|nr:helix-turn-helix transcriptional regulator [Clostridium hydrogenum]